MANKKFRPSNHNKDYPKLMTEINTIKNHYSNFDCKIKTDTLTCTGIIKPTEYSRDYYVKISYKLWGIPKIWIIDPVIEYNEDVHMYKDENNLCLYYHKENPWKDTYHIYDKIIPWTSEWLVFYELYLITGKWLGAAQNHFTPKIND